MTVTANAKINLSLDILGIREDGYHDIDSVMQSISLCDKIDITKNKDAVIKLTCSNMMLPTDEKNLAYAAAKLILNYCNITDMGVNIHILKNIPTEAGLGGGSADAAAVLNGINELFSLELSVDELIILGAKLGADVPFCIVGGTSRCTGIGEVLTPINTNLKYPIILCKPPVGVSTREAYEVCDKYPQKDYFATKFMIEALEDNDLQAMTDCVYNRFDDIMHIADVELIKSIMKSSNALACSMTGSGSAVFGIFENEDNFESLIEILSKKGECFVCYPN